MAHTCRIYRLSKEAGGFSGEFGEAPGPLPNVKGAGNVNGDDRLARSHAEQGDACLHGAHFAGRGSKSFREDGDFLVAFEEFENGFKGGKILHSARDGNGIEVLDHPAKGAVAK